MASRFSTTTLIQMLNKVPVVDSFLLDTVFKRTVFFDTETIVLDDLSDDRFIAAYVSAAATAKAGTSEARSITEYAAPSVIEKQRIPPAELMKRQRGEPFDKPWSPQERFTAWHLEWLGKLRNRVLRTQITQAAEALVYGRVTIKGDSHPDMLMDYGRDASLSITLAGGTAWGADGVNPLNTLQSAALAVSDKGFGAVAKTVIMDSKAWERFIASAAVQAQLSLVRLPATGLKVDPTSPGRHVDDKGVIGDYHIYVYNDAYVDKKTGTVSKYLPDNTALVLDPDSLDGVRAFGAVPLVTRDSDTYVFQAGEFVPDTIKIQEPAEISLRVQSRPLLVPCNVNACARITVA